jgi:hypothetical protein
MRSDLAHLGIQSCNLDQNLTKCEVLVDPQGYDGLITGIVEDEPEVFFGRLAGEKEVGIIDFLSRKGHQDPTGVALIDVGVFDAHRLSEQAYVTCPA